MSDDQSSPTGGRANGQKWYRRIFFIIVFGMAGVFVLLVVTAEITSQPKFCGSHHYLRPYYESWTRSTHKDVACANCHFPPGLTGTIQRKWKAISEVAIYVTKTYKGEPRAEVDDAGCLRSNCHSKPELVPREVDYRGMKFDHQKHLPLMGEERVQVAALPEEVVEELPRGRVLRCASCHAEVVRGNHMSVTESTCFLCHFKGEPANDGISDCRTCHETPTKTIQVGEISFRHEPYVSKGAECRQCHANAVEGNGEVPEQRCLQCHDRPDLLAKYDNHTLIHQVHVTDHKLNCMNCHLEIRHGKTAKTEPGQLDCQSCHTDTHAATQSLYVGAGKGVETGPDPMFLAQVSCTGCHTTHADGEGGLTAIARAESCEKCHGESFAHIEAQWKAGAEKLMTQIRPRLERVKRAIEKAKRRADVNPDDLGSAQTLYETAAKNIDTVERGNPVHNVRFSERLVIESNAQLTTALDLLNGAEGPPSTMNIPRPKSPEGGRCLGCHFGIENVAVTAFGQRFDHGAHLLDADLSCETCHSSAPQEEEGHGETPITNETCMSCHHTEQAKTDCQTCHDDLRTRTVSYQYETAFDHGEHALDKGIACGTCHASDARKEFVGECASCHHTDRVVDKTECETCHTTQAAVYGGTAVPDQSPSIHAEMVECSDCHEPEDDRITTETCSVCHDEGDHEAIRDAWQSKTRRQLAEVAEARTRFQSVRGSRPLSGETSRRAALAEEDARLLSADGSLGVHNPELTDTVLTRDLAWWRTALETLSGKR